MPVRHARGSTTSATEREATIHTLSKEVSVLRQRLANEQDHSGDLASKLKGLTDNHTRNTNQLHRAYEEVTKDSEVARKAVDAARRVLTATTINSSGRPVTADYLHGVIASALTILPDPRPF